MFLAPKVVQKTSKKGSRFLEWGKKRIRYTERPMFLANFHFSDFELFEKFFQVPARLLTVSKPVQFWSFLPFLIMWFMGFWDFNIINFWSSRFSVFLDLPKKSDFFRFFGKTSKKWSKKVSFLTDPHKWWSEFMFSGVGVFWDPVLDPFWRVCEWS